MASLVRAPELVVPEFLEERSGFCMVLIGNKIYFWGGYTQELMRDSETNKLYPFDITLPSTDDNFMDVYDISTSSWKRYKTTNDVPDFGYGSTMVAYRDHLYLFGGWNEGNFSAEVFQLDINSFEWKLLTVSDDEVGVVKPSPRYRTQAVVYDSKMWIFGGVGAAIDDNHIQKDAKFILYRSFSHDYGFGWNNEMFFFDLKRGIIIFMYALQKERQ